MYDTSCVAQIIASSLAREAVCWPAVTTKATNRAWTKPWDQGDGRHYRYVCFCLCVLNKQPHIPLLNRFLTTMTGSLLSRTGPPILTGPFQFEMCEIGDRTEQFVFSKPSYTVRFSTIPEGLPGLYHLVTVRLFFLSFFFIFCQGSPVKSGAKRPKLKIQRLVCWERENKLEPGNAVV